MVGGHGNQPNLVAEVAGNTQGLLSAAWFRVMVSHARVSMDWPFHCAFQNAIAEELSQRVRLCMHFQVIKSVCNHACMHDWMATSRCRTFWSARQRARALRKAT